MTADGPAPGSVSRWVVVTGNGTYDHDENAALPYVPRDLDTVQGLFTDLGYDDAGRKLDATAAELRAFLSDWAADGDRGDGALALYFSGHGDRSPVDERHYLLCRDSRPDRLKGTALAADDLVGLVTETGLSRLLLIVDACYSGQGGVDIVRRLAAQLVAARDADPRTLTAFSVIAAARPHELAEDGAFTHALRAALDDPTLGGNRQPKLYLEQVVDRVNDLLGPFQHATWGTLPSGEGFDFLPNPRYAPDTPHEGIDLAEQRTALTPEARRRREDFLSHFGPRGHGLERTTDRGAYFTGRASALQKLSEWIGGTSELGDAVVVTGSAGVGKSSLLGRLVLIADPVHRATLTDLAPGTPLPLGRVDAAIHARHKLLDDIVTAVADAAGVAADRATLLRALAERTEPLVIVVDALDEAGTAGTDGADGHLVAAFLDRLARTGGVRLVVGARPHVVSALGARFAVMNLDDAQWTAPGDLAAYARKLLRAPDGPGSRGGYTDPGLAVTVAEAVADRAEGNYLVARLTARALAHRATLLDTTVPDWAEQLPRPAAKSPRPAGPAFRWALDQQLGDESERAGRLLLPLALSEGAGLPSTGLWPAIASEVSAGPVTTDDIRWLLDHAGSHIVEALDPDDRSVYRLYHESFADELRAERASPRTSAAVTRALLASVPADPATGLRDWSAAEPYVRDHLATHAVAAGMVDELVVDPLFLLTAEPGALQRALSHVTSPEAVAARTAYERVASVLAGEPDPGVRYTQLKLAALQSGATLLVQGVRQRAPDLPWDTRFVLPFHPPTPYRTIGTFDSDVLDVVAVESERGTLLATEESAGRGVRLWDFDSGELVGQLGHVDGHGAHAMAACGPLLIVPRDYGDPLVVNPVSGRTVGPGTEADVPYWNRASLWAFAESDGTCYAVCLRRDELRVIDLLQGRHLATLRLPERKDPRARALPNALALESSGGRLTVAAAIDAVSLRDEHSVPSAVWPATVLRWTVEPSTLRQSLEPDLVRNCRGVHILALAVHGGSVLVASRDLVALRSSGCRVIPLERTTLEWAWAYTAPEGCRFVRVQGETHLMHEVPGGAEFVDTKGKTAWRTPVDPRPGTRFTTVRTSGGEPTAVSWQRGSAPLRAWTVRRSEGGGRSARSGAGTGPLHTGTVAGRPVLVHPRGTEPPLIVDAGTGAAVGRGGRLGRHFPQAAGRPGSAPLLYFPVPGRHSLKITVIGEPSRNLVLRGVRRGDEPQLRVSRLNGHDVIVGLCASYLGVWSLDGKLLQRWHMPSVAASDADVQVTEYHQGILILVQHSRGYREIYGFLDGRFFSSPVDSRDVGHNRVLSLGNWRGEPVLADRDGTYRMWGTSGLLRPVAGARRHASGVRAERVLAQMLQGRRTLLVLGRDETLSLFDVDADRLACRIHLGTQATALTVVDDDLLGVLTTTGLISLRVPDLASTADN
ncbi:caspase family protein [Streptomyces sp. NPDC059629]|uniref:caspase family protein n=1 Tax=Streptomyces sp. NPDC059629 TaxID=3346889 RepID=UPI0036B1CE65